LDISQRKARLDSAKSGETGSAAVPVDVDEGPKKYTIVVNKKGDKTTYPKKGDKARCYFHGR
jgi:FK506-binding protein 3